MAENA
ncbi:40S ribosomal protein S7-2 [Zea mays]